MPFEQRLVQVQAVLKEAREGGVTTIQVLPGSANLIGGSAVTLELHPAISARAMVFEGAPRSIKMACGENPKNVYGDKGGPSTRMGEAATFRATFEQARAAQDYKSIDALEAALDDLAVFDQGLAAVIESELELPDTFGTSHALNSVSGSTVPAPDLQ